MFSQCTRQITEARAAGNRKPFHFTQAWLSVALCPPPAPISLCRPHPCLAMLGLQQPSHICSMLSLSLGSWLVSLRAWDGDTGVFVLPFGAPTLRASLEVSHQRWTLPPPGPRMGWVGSEWGWVSALLSSPA